MTVGVAAGPTSDVAAARTSCLRKPRLEMEVEVEPLTIIKAWIRLRVPRLVTVVPLLFLIIAAKLCFSSQSHSCITSHGLFSFQRKSKPMILNNYFGNIIRLKVL